MGKGKSLSSEEQVRIRILKAEGNNISGISKLTNRSRSAITSFLKHPETYNQKKAGNSNAKKLTCTDQRRILRTASNSQFTSRRIRDDLQLEVSVRTVQRVIKASPLIKRKKMKRKPILSKAHQERRYSYAMEHVHWKKEWDITIFTDEKKFNMDGPDGFRYYFHDLRKNEVVLSKRHSGGGGVMVWGAISSRGPINLEFIESTQNKQTYLDLVKRNFKIINKKMRGSKWKYQQDNAPCHKAALVMDWLKAQNRDIIDWPPLSPDLNIIENIWGDITRKVYANGKQYSSKHDLKIAIKLAWDGLTKSHLMKYYNSLPRRMIDVISVQGKHTKY